MEHHGRNSEEFQFQNNDSHWEFQRLLEKRPQSRFSEGLSKEARLVIEQLKEENKYNNSPGVRFEIGNENKDRRCSKSHHRKTKTTETRTTNYVTYSESIRKSSLRLERDITDPDFDETKLRKRALGGGPVQSAYETIEIVNACDPEVFSDDDFTIEETAKHNSVEKCIVWMDVNENRLSSENEDETLAE